MAEEVDTNNRELNGGEKEDPGKFLAMELQFHLPLSPTRNNLSIWAGEAGARRN
jgi:hypothetical protein